MNAPGPILLRLFRSPFFVVPAVLTSIAAHAPLAWCAEVTAVASAPAANVAPHGALPSAAPASGGAPKAAATAAPSAAAVAPGEREAPSNEPNAAPSPDASPDGDPHGGAGGAPLLSGSPFASPAHRHQAELLRAGRSTIPQNQSVPSEGIPPGTIGMLIRDADRKPVPGVKVKLFITRESIAEGDKETVQETTSDAEGRAGFVGLSTDTSYKYEAVVEQGGSRYSTGSMRLRRETGQVAVLFVFPTTEKLDETFVLTRMLYALQPREDIFQIDTILRIQNGGTKTWQPKDFYVELPEEASAFRPPRAEGDIRGVAEGNRVHITGSFTPGQHELTFGFQLPNPRTTNIQLKLKTVPHLTDARVFLEATDTMGLQVEGLRPAEKTRGQEGQNALMAAADFLGSVETTPASLAVTITGMPARGNGNLIASMIAGLIALFGIAFAVARPDKEKIRLSDEDRTRAKTLLLDELVTLEQAYRAKEIGPKTYEQARKTLIDSIARIAV